MIYLTFRTIYLNNQLKNTLTSKKTATLSVHCAISIYSTNNEEAVECCTTS